MFNFSHSYNSGVHPLYNGNISETKWRTANSDSSLKSYAYSYDALNRITAATDNTGKYNLSGITYDKMGNILSLTRNGWQNGAPFADMDVLSYNYGTENANILYQVTDSGNANHGFKDGTNSGYDYTYDDNGNMTVNQNKGITSIFYNHLNMPTEIKFNNSSTQKINYILDATGTKLRKVTIDNGNITTTDYSGNYIYENNTLRQFFHPEGYVEPNRSGGCTYVYNYKDQVQNIRLSYADLDGNGSINPSTEILHERNYYPFGLLHSGYNIVINGTINNHKQYQDQEFTEDLGLNVHEWKYRFSDPAIGRFWQIDPLAESYVHNGTYNFSENRVVDAVELEGLEAVTIHLDGRTSLGVTGSISIGIAFDFNGGVGAFTSIGGGGGLAIGAAAGGGVSVYPFLQSVNDLKGWGGSVVAGVDFIAGLEISHDFAIPSLSDIPQGLDGFDDMFSYTMSRGGMTITGGVGEHAIIGVEATYTWMKSSTWGEMGEWIVNQFEDTGEVVKSLQSVSTGLGNQQKGLSRKIERYGKKLEKAKNMKNEKAAKSIQQRIDKAKTDLNNLSNTKRSLDNLIEIIK
ncbi:MAG: DUF1664 domain-containing protein [Flavobacteriaceae bacterium]|nr:DUF1664 domain-containing protein [Flavobacteriaceae bacterium]